MLSYLISYISFNEIFEVIKNSNKYYIASVLGLTALNVYLQFLKWKIVCNSLLNENVNKRIWNSLFYGFSAGIITPIRIGEYLGRKLAFDNQSLLRVTVSSIIEKFAFLYVILLFGGIISLFFVANFYSIYYSIPLAFLVIALLYLSFALLNKGDIKSERFDRLAAKYKFFHDLKLELQYVKKIKRESIKDLFRISIILYVVIILQYSLLAKAFDQSGDIILFLAAGSIILFIKSILSFLSFAELGIREGSSVFILSKLGYSSSVGFNSAIFLFLFNLVLPSIVGLVLFLRKDS